MRGKKNGNYLNLLVLVGAFLVSCSLAELFIRLNPSLYCQGYRPSPSNKLLYELFPNYKIASLGALISSQGLNDRIFTVDKPANIFRIAVVGDSTSFGWKVPREKSFPKILEKILNDKKKNEAFEVINFSVPGYNTSQELAVIKEKVVKFNPDMVILVYCGNDTHICNYFKPKITPLNFLYNRSYLIHFALRAIDLQAQNHPAWFKGWVFFKKEILSMYYYNQLIYPFCGLEETIYVGYDPPVSPDNVPRQYWYMLGIENYQKHICEISRFLKERDIEFVSSGFLDFEAMSVNLNSGILNICNFFVLFPSQEYLISECLADGHLNIKGNGLVAKFIYDFLNTKKLLPE